MGFSEIKVAIIGSGRVGSALAILLSRQNFREVSVFDRDPEKLNILIDQFNAEIRVSASLNDAVAGADLVFLAVQDRYIQELAQEISILLRDTDPHLQTQQYFAHLSGSLTSAVLQPLAAAGAVTFSLHPLQSLADVAGAVRGLAGSYFSFEGDRRALPTAEFVVEALAGHLVQLNAADKALYHAAAVVSSNFFIALEGMAIKMMRGIGVDSETARQMLLPLIRGSFENLERAAPAEALTGPIVRGDDQTVASHIAALEDKLPDYLAAYRTLAGLNVDLAAQKSGVSFADFPSLKKINL
jgi:predicted short-subunit dehydrogenase-like oxidoreductase (DUF2520 family)